MEKIKKTYISEMRKGIRKLFFTFSLLAFGMLVSSLACYFSAYAQEFAVVAHPSAPDIPIEELKKIYLGDKKNLPDGTKVTPTLIKGTPEEFFQKVLGMGKKQFFQYWMIRIVGGGSIPPKDVESEEQAINLIRENKGAIGIVSVDRAKKEGLKILIVIK
jgi:hypothetical protein